MYVVFAEELENAADAKTHTVATLEQAFAQIACRCGLSYAFEQEQEGWRLVFTRVVHSAEYRTSATNEGAGWIAVWLMGAPDDVRTASQAFSAFTFDRLKTLLGLLFGG